MKNYLQEYAKFVRTEKLDEFVTIELNFLKEFNIPLLQFFKHLTAEQLRETSKISAEKLLTTLEDGTSLNEVSNNLENWKNDNLDGIPRSAISLKDITQVYALQKLSLFSLIPSYTSDPAMATTLTRQLELHFSKLQELGLDMYETIRAEEETRRREVEENFEDLFNNSNDLIHFVAPDGTIMYVNNAWLAAMGYQEREVVGRSIFDFIKEENKQEYLVQRQRLVNKEISNFFINSCFITRHQHFLTLEGFVSARLKNDAVIFTRAVLRDITERTAHEKKIKAINEQLAEREESLRHLVQHAPDAIVVSDANSIIKIWNCKAEEIFGWKEAEVLDKDLTGFIIPPHLREGHRKGMERYIATGEASILNTTAEFPALCKDGQEIVVAITISASWQAGNRLFIAFLRDITRQKKNEADLEQHRLQLEKSNHELEQYAWLTSHDLKEPVRKILTFSDALLHNVPHSLGERESNFLKKINKAAIRMNTLIEAVLQYSNVSNEAALFQPTDLSIILQEVLDDLEVLIQNTNAVIIADPLPTVSAIPIQMRQLFQNLITNALKYKKPDVAPVVEITCTSQPTGYTIEVKDNGIGFENEYATKIFQVFQRLLASKALEGTGIGLALCKKIMDTHQGSIYAESKPGVGSSFILHLPAPKA